MKKLLALTLMVVLAFSLCATITYSTISSKTSGKLVTYTGTTTVAVTDTSGNAIYSPTFTKGYEISNRGIMVSATIVAAVQHTVNAAVASLKGTLQVSTDNSNWADVVTYDAYIKTGVTAGQVIIIPASTVGMLSPYYRIKWVGYNAVGAAYTADILGTITTSITIAP